MAEEIKLFCREQPIVCAASLATMEVLPDSSVQFFSQGSSRKRSRGGQLEPGMDFLPVLDPPALSVHREGPAVLQSSMGMSVVLNSRLWGELPEEILFLIMKALPPAIYCQFRSVCRAWRHLLSPPPDWTYFARAGITLIASSASKRAVRFMICQSDDDVKCRILPDYPDLCSKMAQALVPNCPVLWHLADVDEGLFCYYAYTMYGMAVAICNPVTHFFRVIPPEENRYIVWHFKLKLIVDRETKSFKLVFMEQRSVNGVMAVFDSTRPGWKRLYHSFSLADKDFFVRKNVIFVYSTNPGSSFSVFAMELDSLHKKRGRRWKQRGDEFCDGKPDSCFVVRYGSETLLVRSHPGRRSQVQIHTAIFKDTKSSRGLDFNVSAGYKILHVPEASARYPIHAACGRGYICIVFRAGLVATNEVPVEMDADICVKYSFVTGSLRMMSCCPKWNTFGSLLPWEPSMDAEVHM